MCCGRGAPGSIAFVLLGILQRLLNQSRLLPRSTAIHFILGKIETREANRALRLRCSRDPARLTKLRGQCVEQIDRALLNQNTVKEGALDHIRDQRAEA